jgi:hypothetical protein
VKKRENPGENQDEKKNVEINREYEVDEDDEDDEDDEFGLGLFVKPKRPK